jgi:nucleoside-diphosphate-sugar epimerase
MDRPQHILVTGAAGYIGSALVRDLLLRGHRVTAVDSMVFGEDGLADLRRHDRLQIHRLDVRSLHRGHLTGMQAVVDLAGLSGDSVLECGAAGLDSGHHRAQVRLAQLARSCGIPRYLLASCCSVYGHASEQVSGEDAPVRPLTHHAQSCLLAEAAILPLATAGFAPAVVRLGLVHGRGSRMRLDLMVHAMVLSALRLRQITLDNGGMQCRGHLHLSDAVRGLVAVLGAPAGVVSRQVFNISHHSVSALQIAEVIGAALGGPGPIRIHPDGGVPDLHHHRPSHQKAVQLLRYAPQMGLADSVRELIEALDSAAVSESPEILAMRWIHEILAQGREDRAALAYRSEYERAAATPPRPTRSRRELRLPG